MSKYIIVRTYCDSLDISNQIISCLLEKRLVAGSQIVAITSEYWWNNEKRKKEEFQLSFRSRYDLFPTIKKEILNIHSYEVPEISCIEILDGNQEFFDWIDKEVEKGVFL